MLLASLNAAPEHVLGHCTQRLWKLRQQSKELILSISGDGEESASWTIFGVPISNADTRDMIDLAIDMTTAEAQAAGVARAFAQPVAECAIIAKRSTRLDKDASLRT